MGNYDSNGFYVLRPRNPIGAHSLINHDDPIVDMYGYRISKFALAGGRYRLEHSNYSWVGQMWEWYLKCGDVPPLRRSVFRAMNSSPASRLVSVVCTHTIQYMSMRSGNKTKQTFGPFRADDPKSLASMFDGIRERSDDAIAHINNSDKSVGYADDIADHATNTINAIIIWDDGTYDTKSISPSAFASMCGMVLQKS